MGTRATHLEGFTLIELSIVLVIIGLIVGGVLVGRDLIHAAEARRVISEVESFNTAVNTFRAKYDCLPGDCANATTFFGTAAGCNGGYSNPTGTETCGGNGNGIIESWDIYGSVPPVSPAAQEGIAFWNHLGSAGLIAGQYRMNYFNWEYMRPEPGVTVPTSSVSFGSGSVWGAGYEMTYFNIPVADGNYFPVTGQVLLLGANSAGFHLAAGVVPISTIAAIDAKMDDGLPGRAIVMTLQHGAWLSSTNCSTTADPSTAVYPISSGSCLPLFLMKW